MKKRKHFVRKIDYFQLFLVLFLCMFFCIMAYPLLYVLSASVSDPDLVNAGKIVLLPKGFNLEGYQYVFKNKDIITGYVNTIFYTVVGTLVNLMVTLPCAYALSRKEMVDRGKLMVFFMITMYFSGGLIPSYLNIKSMGLVNTRTIMVINGALSVYNMIVARTFFASSIPNEIVESARIDGCDDFQIFNKIALPLSKALSAVMVLYYGVGHWNEYFTSMIYLDDREKFSLQLFLKEILVQGEMLAGLTTDTQGLSVEEIAVLRQAAENATLTKYCVIVAAALPMLIIYPRLQKYFEKGVMIGSVKG